MAHIQKYYISEILKDICGRLGDVTGAIFVDHRPKVVNEAMSEMIVVSIPGVLNEQNAWQKGMVRLDIMVRNKKGGMSNIAKLDNMLSLVMSKFPISTPRFSATNIRLMLKGDDGMGFTQWVLTAKLIVNTTDNYTNKL